MKQVALASALLTVLIWASPPVFAAPSVAEVLEQARAKSRDLEELKKVLNGPDANMRLATFEVMVDSGDETMRELAIDSGLASTDAMMQALAMKAIVLAQKSLSLSLEVDTSQAEEMQSRAKAYLEKNGSLYQAKITGVEAKDGVFKMSQYQGQVTGNQVNFTNGYDKGTLTLEDEATLKGPVTLYKGGYSGFIATWKVR
ncbi:MAG: hypothetical protein ACR2PZ_26680 [Pseudomonadales bacterium]